MFDVGVTYSRSHSLLQEYFVNILRPHANGRPVYILGESFGALLAIALAPKCKYVLLSASHSMLRARFKYLVT